MATFVIRSSEQTGAAATSGKKTSWEFSKLNTPVHAEPLELLRPFGHVGRTEFKKLHVDLQRHRVLRLR